MKKLLLIVLAILNLLNLELLSQDYYPFPDTNTAWNTVGDNDFTSDQWHFRYAVHGDTLINSILYSKVYKMYDSTILNPNSTYFAAIRENESKQVFCIIPGFSESILYDFSLDVGDTIFYNIGGGLYSNEVDFWDEDHYRIVIEKDSMLMLNNQYRRKWEFEGTMGYQTWIEGVGSINWYGLFNPLITAMVLNGDGYQFACFKQNDTVLYLNNMYCDQCFCELYTGAVEHKLGNGNIITIYPNPSSGKITIRKNENEEQIDRVELIEFCGKRLIDNSFYFNDNSEIKIGKLKSGLYLIKTFNTENEILGINKIVIE